LIVLLLLTIGELSDSGPLTAQDWPQINGANRNGFVAPGTLLEKWPSEGPKRIWSHSVGQGFSGPAVVANKLIIFHRPAENYVVEAIESDTGKLIWSVELPSRYDGGGPDQDNGPKAVPLIHHDRVYLYGTGGNLFCVSLEDGKSIWQKNVLEIYRGPRGYFGAGSSPIVINERLLLNVGGDQAGVVAFDLETGKELWKSFDDRASYSSPIEAQINGLATAVFVTRMHVVGLDPETGNVLFETDFGKRGPTVNGAMPVFTNDHLFINSAYGIGAQWLSTKGGKLETVWANDNSFSSHYSTPIYFNGYLYGTAGREDFGNGSFRCVEAATGLVKWTQNDIPVGHTLCVDNQLLLLDCEGTLHQIKPSETRFDQMRSAKILDGPSRSMPAISDGKLFARTNASNKKGELSCFQIGESKKANR
jgi:outer membrane protein assembly factor BamB